MQYYTCYDQQKAKPKVLLKHDWWSDHVWRDFAGHLISEYTCRSASVPFTQQLVNPMLIGLKNLMSSKWSQDEHKDHRSMWKKSPFRSTFTIRRKCHILYRINQLHNLYTTRAKMRRVSKNYSKHPICHGIAHCSSLTVSAEGNRHPSLHRTGASA